jgi:hypothetical protein
MRDALSKVLRDHEAEDSSVARVLAEAFFRRRPLQAGAVPGVGHSVPGRASRGLPARNVVSLVDRKAIRERCDGFLHGGQPR